ncbi:MAG: hypothetical protein KKF62_10035 [Bacteroidetes bacterium]|nr:hypothetical protein [Bacteroidota bacterium]MBU1115461.1 hypothetical protein [Bacteroidota bacterium]MBU1798516.1 hypothetical protein [Bacteroidota bacterium]
MNHLNELLNNKEIFFRFIAEKMPVFTGANVFLRDIQYGIKFFFEKKNILLKYPAAEKLALEFTSALVSKNELVQYKPNTWKVNFVFREVIEKKEAVIVEN